MAVEQHPNASRPDVYSSAHFSVEIDDIDKSGNALPTLRSVEGGGVKAEVVNYQMGEHGDIWRQIGKPKYEPIKMTFGIAYASRHPTQRTKMAVVGDGKAAVTHYTLAERFPGCTLLRCKLETGRTHQIRVHLASIHHPLVGDSTYLKGAQKCPAALLALLAVFPRQALHAAQLGLKHPVTGEWVEWQAPLPQDFSQLLENIRSASLERA